MAPTVGISHLSFTYPGIDGRPPLIEDVCFSLNAGQCCLLLGSNGTGKTTILKILGGKHVVDPSMVWVLGRSAFHNMVLTSSGDLCYLDGQWRRDVAFAGYQVNIQMGISASKMIFGVAGVDLQEERRAYQVLMEMWGVSVGYSCSRQINPDQLCIDRGTCFAGRWSDSGKLILILMICFRRL